MHKNMFMHEIQEQLPASSLSLTEQALISLRRDVTLCVFEPGKKLKVDELQAMYGFSSSPLREALSKLSQEGLIRADDRKGFRVAEISKDDLQDITRMRLLMDSQALELAIKQGDDDWEAGIVAAHYKLDKLERSLGDGPLILDEVWIGAHKEFHLALLAACSSPRLLQWCSHLFDQAERYRQYSARHRVTGRRKSTEHKRIMDAVLKRDAETACVLLMDHISSTQKNVLAALDF
jgi:DNA-binding GntR family transcriptional regulator